MIESIIDFEVDVRVRVVDVQWKEDTESKDPQGFRT